MKQCKYILRNPSIKDNCLTYLRELPSDVVWEVIVRKYRKRRSISQNSLYWMWLHEIANEYGEFSAETFHEFFKRQFLPPQTIEVKGHVVDAPVSTTRLSTVEFTDYLERIAAFAATEMGIELSEPNRWAA